MIKNILTYVCLILLIPCKSQDIVKVSGFIKLMPNPCLSEICLPGIVWALETDTALFVLTKDNKWLWGDFQLMIRGKEYIGNDYLSINGEISTQQEIDGEYFYEFEIDDYDSIMTESKLWSNLSGGYGVEMIECCHTTTFLKIETDPLINTVDEKQILVSKDSLQTWTKLGNIRESDKKIYFRDLHNNQGLLYDFGASKADIIKIVNYAHSYDPDTIIVRVENIDTIEYMGTQRQRFEVKDTLSRQKDYWITGVGSVKGLLNSFLKLNGGFRELLCVKVDGDQIYQNPDRGSCYIDSNTVGITNAGKNDINVYPNPSGGFVNIDFSGEITSLSYNITNSTGQLVYSDSLKEHRIVVNLETGLYFLRVLQNDRLIYENKIMIIK